MNATESKFDPARYYVIIVPLLMTGSFLALLGNVYLLLCIRWIRKQAMTANLLLSLSLAAADAWAALLLLSGWIVNNVIPYMFQLVFGEWIRCYYLVMELLRLSGMITSAVHLLVLALNHFFSIVSPLKYQITVTPAFSYVSIFLLWTLPLISTFSLGSAYDGDGFRSASCHLKFYFHFSFRLAIFLQFAVPLIVMLILYSYILIRLSLARKRCALMQRQQRKQTGRFSNGETIALLSDGKKSFLLPRNARRKHEDSYSRKQSTESRGSVITFSFNRMSAIKSKIKAVTTTLLILGTFAIGWLPAVFMFVLLCFDCLFTPNESVQMRVFVLNTIVNTMIVSKLILNPFIYAYRLTEIRYAIWVMHATRFGRRPLDISRMPMQFKRMAPSVASANPAQQRPSRGLIVPEIAREDESCRLFLSEMENSSKCQHLNGRPSLDGRLCHKNSMIEKQISRDQRFHSWHRAATT